MIGRIEWFIDFSKAETADNRRGYYFIEVFMSIKHAGGIIE